MKKEANQLDPCAVPYPQIRVPTPLRASRVRYVGDAEASSADDALQVLHCPVLAAKPAVHGNVNAERDLGRRVKVRADQGGRGCSLKAWARMGRFRAESVDVLRCIGTFEVVRGVGNDG